MLHDCVVRILKIGILHSTVDSPRYFAVEAMLSSHKTNSMGRRERAVWQAAIAALLVHAVALGALEYWGTLPAPERQPFAEVGFVEYEETETRTMEEAVRERMEARMEQVLNAAADSRADRAADVRSSRAEAERMAAEVEAELRALEQQTFEELAEGRDGPDLPEAGRQDVDRPLEDYEGWDARYDGQRRPNSIGGTRGTGPRHSGIPLSRCGVVFAIAVSPGGEVKMSVRAHPPLARGW